MVAGLRVRGCHPRWYESPAFAAPLSPMVWSYDSGLPKHTASLRVIAFQLCFVCFSMLSHCFLIPFRLLFVFFSIAFHSFFIEKEMKSSPATPTTTGREAGTPQSPGAGSSLYPSEGFNGGDPLP